MMLSKIMYLAVAKMRGGGGHGSLALVPTN